MSAKKGATGRERVLLIDNPWVACSHTAASECDKLSRSLALRSGAWGRTAESRSHRRRTSSSNARSCRHFCSATASPACGESAK
eukprot:scaffold12003_cov67-Isochrysis_galbana.AAC.1